MKLSQKIRSSLQSRLSGATNSAMDVLWLRHAASKGLQVCAGARCVGRPTIELVAGGQAILREGAVLRSRERGYHTSITPVRLMADAPGALIDIGPGSRLNGTSIHARSKVIIGSDTYIASGTHILDSNGHVRDAMDRVRGERDEAAPISIGSRVWIGINVVILKGVTIGDDVIVGAGAVVTRDLRAGTICAGNPATAVADA